ncbi:MAG TPA: hypothetical protein ENO22_14825 [candidate division Zixibacteria bacterium]|nr:hypothetical protein [candidate division Zixibacteria bacterium]
MAGARLYPGLHTDDRGADSSARR